MLSVFTGEGENHSQLEWAGEREEAAMDEDAF